MATRKQQEEARILRELKEGLEKIPGLTHVEVAPSSDGKGYMARGRANGVAFHWEHAMDPKTVIELIKIKVKHA